MKQRFFSVFIWLGISLLILLWLPLLFIVSLVDRDPVNYRTGKVFRKLGLVISRINPNWHITIEGETDIDDRAPYVVVSNHLSNADIPLISNLPWEMKWVAKAELFKIPIVGWMMRLAKDIPVDRSSTLKKVGVFKRVSHVWDHNCSVMFFPEGTRSRSGQLKKYSSGAFALAIEKGVPVLPLVIDGTQECLPKKTWVFTKNVYIRLKVLRPVSTKHLTKQDISSLMADVRQKQAEQLSRWRGQELSKVDATIA